MKRGTYRVIGLFLLAASSMAAGCSENKPRPIADEPRSASLLLGNEPSAGMATEVGRSEWPSVYGRVEGGEFTVYLEHYQDYQGNRLDERNTPRRYFDSYKVGTPW